MKVRWFDAPFIPLFYLFRWIFQLGDGAGDIVGKVALLSIVGIPIITIVEICDWTGNDWQSGVSAIGWIIIVIYAMARYIYGDYK